MDQIFRIEDRLAKYKDLSSDEVSISEIKYLQEEFVSEQLEVWTSAALTIGRLAAQGQQELKKFMQQQLIDYTNIHHQRHALTALGSYYSFCEDKEEKFKFLKQYRNYTENQAFAEIKETEVTETLSIKKFLQQIMSQFAKLPRLKELLTGAREVKTKEDRELLEQAIANQQQHLPQVINSITSNFSEFIKESEEFEKAENYQELLSILKEELVGLDSEDFLSYIYNYQDDYGNNLAVYYHREQIMNKMLQQENISQEERFQFDLRINYGLVNPRFPVTWYIPSIVNCLFELLETELPIIDFVDDLCQVGTERIEYVINLPRFLYLLFTTEEKNKQEQGVIDNTIEKLGAVIIQKIKASDKPIEDIHLGDLLLEINWLYQQVKDKDFLIEVLPQGIIEKEILQEYNSIKQIENLQLQKNKAVKLLLKIRDKFTSELEWKTLDFEELNTKTVFDMIIRSRKFNIDLKKKIKIVLTEIQRLKYKNQNLLNLLLRELKHLYFEFINETENDNDLVDRVWFEIYSLIELVEEWNWPGTINKDLASIIINAFDLLWSNGDYEELFQVIFTVFNYVPEQRIIEEMIKYSKNPELEQILRFYEEHRELNYSNLDKQISMQNLLGVQVPNKFPEEIMTVYQLINKLSLEKKVSDDEVINVFDIQKQLKYKNKLDINTNQFKLKQLNEQECQLFKKYFLIPKFRYNLFKEKPNFDYLKKSSQDEQEDIKQKIDLQAKEYLNQLKQLISDLNLVLDKYINVFENPDYNSNAEKVSNQLSALLNDYRNLMDKLPVLEKKYVFNTIETAEKSIMENKEYLVKINVACQDENEAELLRILNEKLEEWEIISELRNEFENIIHNNLLQRGMFDEYNNLFIKEKDQGHKSSLSAWLNKGLTNQFIIWILFLLPAVLYYAGVHFPEFKFDLVGLSIDFYVCYVYVIKIVLTLVLLYLIAKVFCYVLSKFLNLIFYCFRGKQDIVFDKYYNKIFVAADKKYNYQFFLPKLLGVIFVIHLNFAIVDELVFLTYQMDFYLKLVLMIIFLTFVYYFLKMFQFGNLEMEETSKIKRVKKIMSLGFSYSFIINLLITLTYSEGIALRQKEVLSEIGKKVFEIDMINYHLGQQIIDLTSVINNFLFNKIVIMPEVIIFGTIQMFFIAVILEFFLQQEKIIKD
ncbi:MAG: hypothetical protein ACQEP9_04035 [Bacillota bacterium]